jgi:diguanylate cyclase (GGDEF)-like protein/PAS domain S-box-containing protein
VRVGVDHSPPFYSVAPDGSVSGLAVDVFNEAARRKGIRLQWVFHQDTPLDDLLAAGQVHMWPLVGATPERAKRFFLSEPWLESDYVLVSLESHRIRTAEEAAGQTIAQARLRMTTVMAQRHLSRSRMLVKLRRSDAIQAVCSGEAPAAVVESRVLDSILLSRPEGCESARFNISALAGATTPLGIIAAPDYRAEATALREGISELAADGYLTKKLDEWSPFSAEGARSVYAQQSANARNLTYRRAVALVLALACVLAWVAWRGFRLKRAAEDARANLAEAQRRFTAFMDHSPALSFMKDAAGRLLYVNKAWLQAFHRTRDDVLGQDDYALFPLHVAKELRRVDLQLLKESAPRQLMEEIPVANGEHRTMLVVKFPFSNAAGERFIGGTAIDVTERQAALRDLEASEARYRELFENNPLPAWVYDRQTLAFLTVNAAAIQRYGWSREEFMGGLKLPDLLSAGDLILDPNDAEAIDRAHAVSGAWWHQSRDGIRLSVEVTSYEMEYERHPARLMIVRDLTEQERTLEQLRVSEERWQLALRGTGDALWDWDVRGGHVFRSSRWGSMLGYSPNEIGDTRDDFLALLHPEDTERVETAVRDYFARKTDAFAVEYRLRHKDGSWRWIMDRGRAVWDERGRPLRMAGSHTDITSRKEAEERLELEAHTDPLTSLPNRREFDTFLWSSFCIARNSGEPLSVCVWDLDRFKQVNDSWGHQCGDQVLMRFAATLRSHLRPTDLVARIGGDEFMVAMPGTAISEAVEIGRGIQRDFADKHFEACGQVFTVTASFGLAELATRHTHQHALVAEADQNLYEAKRERTLTLA